MPPRKRPTTESITTADSYSEPPKKSMRNKAGGASKTENKMESFGLEWIQSDEMIDDILPFALALVPTESARKTNLKPCKNVAAFDMDYNLICCKSGRKWPTGPTDWKWLFDCIPDKLRELHKNGTRLIIITNQAGIEKKNTQAKDIMSKIEQIISDVNVPMLAFMSCGENHYRKPAISSWQFLEKRGNDGIEFDRSTSIYVGDAAGRPNDYVPGRKKDFSCADRKFAANLDVSFFTPEEFFLNEKKASFEWRTPHPKTFLDEAASVSYEKSYHSEKQELILMMGMPASGKSTFVKKYLVPHKYEWVNRDTLKTAEKCIKMARLHLENGKSVVVDNTSPSMANRAEYVAIAVKNKVPVRCFVMLTNRELANHLNFYRQYKSKGTIRRVPDTGYNVFKSRFENVDATKEGFAEVKYISFVPTFANEQEKQDFLLWQN